MATTFRKLHLRWKDPRLLVGIALIALSTAGGGILLSGPQTAQVYQATSALLPGTPLAQAPLVLVDIDPALAGAYIGPGDAKEATVTRTIRKGELVAHSSLLDDDVRGHTRVVLALAAPVPSGVSAGDAVSLWAITRAGAAGGEASAEELTADALLVAESAAEGLGLGGYAAELQIPDDIAAEVLAVTGADASFMVSAGGAK